MCVEGLWASEQETRSYFGRVYERAGIALPRIAGWSQHCRVQNRTAASRSFRIIDFVEEIQWWFSMHDIENNSTVVVVVVGLTSSKKKKNSCILFEENTFPPTRLSARIQTRFIRDENLSSRRNFQIHRPPGNLASRKNINHARPGGRHSFCQIFVNNK